MADAKRGRSHRHGGRGRFLRRHEIKGGAEDSISSLPDVILQHILSFIPTKFAIKSSLLSKRWRHVWLDTPSISFDNYNIPEAAWVNETLSRYTAPQVMRFDLQTKNTNHAPHMDKWIEFAISRHVEDLDLSLDYWLDGTIPDLFYISSSLKQLKVNLHFSDMVPRRSVSWTSLKNLFLHSCSISDDSLAKILSGCPILESLTLCSCDELMFLDLTKSPRLRTLQVKRNVWVQGPTQIVAPHIQCLRLINYQLPCTLVDVSSLSEANLNIGFSSVDPIFKADFLQAFALDMLEKLQHVEKLTFGENFLRILSLAVLCGVHFPMLKVKALRLETHISQYVIPGIKMVLQTSPDLKKLEVHTGSLFDTIPGEYLDDLLKYQGLKPVQCWKSVDGVRWNKSLEDVKSRHLVSFVKLLLENTKALEKMSVLFGEHYLRFKKMVPTLSHNNKVSIVFSH